MSGVDVVCHQAAVVGAGIDAADAPAFASHNDFGTAVLLAAMQAAGCRRLVLASSMVVYGDGRYACARSRNGDAAPPRLTPTWRQESSTAGARSTDRSSRWVLVGEDAPLRPRSLYAASKLAQENYALAWSLATGGSVTALRYHNVYGEGMPRDTPYSGVAAMFRSSLEAGDPPRVYEDGRQARDFIARPRRGGGQRGRRRPRAPGVPPAQRLLRATLHHRRDRRPAVGVARRRLLRS